MARKKATAANSTVSDVPQVRHRVKADRRNRSKKRRPEDIPGLVAALNEGLLDQRTQAARDALTIRDALAREPRQVVVALVRDALALDAVIMSRISAELLRPDSNLIDAFGNPHEIIRRYWSDVRAGILKGSKALVELDERTASTDTGGNGEPGLDISTIILEAQRDVDSR